MTVLYFAYGSNLKATRMLARIPSAAPLSTAALHGWTLTLDKPSKDGSGKANLAIEANRTVWGVVYRISPDHWADLDAFEPGYTRTEVEVVADGDRISVQTYVSSVPPTKRVAFDWYKSLIVEGAREHGLPADYVSVLEAFPVRRDPNA